MNLYQKLNAIANDLGAIEKSGENAYFKYKFIEYNVVVAELKALLKQHEVAILLKQSVAEQTPGNNNKTHTLVTSTWEIVNAEKPEERYEVTLQGESEDTGDKGINKASTACHKLLLLRTFAVSDYDPDEDADQPAPAKQAQPAKQPARTGPDWENLKRGYSAATTMNAIEAIDAGLKALKLPDSPEKRALWKHREACVDRIKQVTTADRAGK